MIDYHKLEGYGTKVIAKKAKLGLTSVLLNLGTNKQFDMPSVERQPLERAYRSS